MAFDSVELKTSILSKALSRSHVNMICILYLLSSISLSSGCSGNLHGFEDADLTGWEDCGGSSWYIDPAKGHESRSSLRSGPIECTGISRICREVQGPAIVTFWWQCGPLRQGIGELSFMVDDTRHVCSSAEWSPISYTVRDNKTHQMTWEYRKIKCYPKNAGAGWIDDLCISSGIPSTPSEVKLENISTTSTDNASSGTRVISSGCIIDLSNLTIITEQINMEPNNVTINPFGDVLIRPKEVNISPDRITMNTSYVDIHSEAISVEAKGYTNLMVNTSLNATTSALPATQSINVTIDSIASPLKMIPLRTDLPPSISLISPENFKSFFVGVPIAFNFIPVDDIGLERCALYINCSEVNSSAIINGSVEEQTLNYKFTEIGLYNWHIVCEDESHQFNTSDKRSISIRPDTVYVDKNKTNGPEVESGRWYYKGIQEAIDDVVQGTTIIVEQGEYREIIIINKPARLIRNLSNDKYNGENIKPKVVGRFEIDSDRVLIDGFEILPSQGGSKGVCTKDDRKRYNYINISHCSIKGNNPDKGIYVLNSENIMIMDNTIDDNGDGGSPMYMYFKDCLAIHIYNNTINKNRSANLKERSVGIELTDCRNVSILHNDIYKTNYGENS